MHHAPQVRLPASTTAYRSAAMMSEERGGSDDGFGSGIIQAWCCGMDGEDWWWFAVWHVLCHLATEMPADGSGGWCTRVLSYLESLCVPMRVRQTLTFC